MVTDLMAGCIRLYSASKPISDSCNKMIPSRLAEAIDQSIVSYSYITFMGGVIIYGALIISNR